jgi:hypothetical protein
LATTTPRIEFTYNDEKDAYKDFEATMQSAYDSLVESLTKLGILKQPTQEESEEILTRMLPAELQDDFYESGAAPKPEIALASQNEVATKGFFDGSLVVIPGIKSITLQWQKSPNEIEAVSVQPDAPLQVSNYVHRLVEFDSSGKQSVKENVVIHDATYFRPSEFGDPDVPNAFGVFAFPTGASIGWLPEEMWSPEKERLVRLVNMFEQAVNASPSSTPSEGNK